MTDTKAPEGRRGLDQSLIGGLAVSGAARLAVQLLGWTSTLVVARLLNREDYGLVGMGIAYLGLIQLISEFGLGTAVIQEAGMGEEVRASIGGISVAAGVFLCLLSAALATPIARFFGEPAVRNVIIAQSTTFIIAGFRVLPSALLTRELRFHQLAAIDTAEAVVLAATTLVLAILGLRYWALVGGMIVSATVATVWTAAARPHRLAWPRQFAPILGSLRFGWNVMLSRVAWYAYSNADFVVVGRVLGAAALGAYTFGWQIASIPVDKVTAVLNRVALPVFASVQSEPASIRRYLLGLIEGLAAITFPVSIGMAIVAPEFVLVALGEHWRAAIVPLRLLALYAGIRSLVALFPMVLIAIGEARHTMLVGVWSALVLPVLFYFGSHWGTTGVALVWVLGYPLIGIPFLVLHTTRHVGVPLRDLLRAVAPATGGTLFMAVLLAVLRRVVIPGWPIGARLAVEIVVGAAAYTIYVAAIHGERLRAFRDLWRSLRSVRA